MNIVMYRGGCSLAKWKISSRHWREVAMSDSRPRMAQENFAASTGFDSDEKADFSSDEGALDYANRQLDKLVSAMRYKLEKHIVGWPEEDRELNTYEALRHLLRDVNFGHAAYMEADYANPQLTKMGATSRVQFQLPSPDCQYHSALLHGDYVYRLRGYRGTCSVFQVTVYQGHACDLVGWQTISNANNHDTPEFAAGNVVDVIFSRRQPDDLSGAIWLQLPEGHCELHIRQYYGDWEKEEPADLALTVEEQSFPAALLTRETSELRFHRLVDLLRVHTDFYREGVQGHLDADPHVIPEMIIPGAFEGTSYFNGHFRCRPDEAVILEIDRPTATYWNMALFQMQYEPGDWWARLSSYNLTQVCPEHDGRVRFIASWADPGVSNWLDCSGRIWHLVCFRFFMSGEKPGSPQLRTVPLADLEKYLERSTPRVSMEQRQAQLRTRLESVIRRRFTDF